MRGLSKWKRRLWATLAAVAAVVAGLWTVGAVTASMPAPTERCSDDPRERWYPTSGRRSFPQCDTLETAIREASGRIDWLADVVKRQA
jgi:hypothetical protein